LEEEDDEELDEDDELDELDEEGVCWPSKRLQPIMSVALSRVEEAGCAWCELKWERALTGLVRAFRRLLAAVLMLFGLFKWLLALEIAWCSSLMSLYSSLMSLLLSARLFSSNESF
jgi:hypothetical protein